VREEGRRREGGEGGEKRGKWREGTRRGEKEEGEEEKRGMREERRGSRVLIWMRDRKQTIPTNRTWWFRYQG
jgi:hypothetical protein